VSGEAPGDQSAATSEHFTKHRLSSPACRRCSLRRERLAACRRRCVGLVRHGECAAEHCPRHRRVRDRRRVKARDVAWAKHRFHEPPPGRHRNRQRIGSKSAAEPHERVAKESQLQRVSCCGASAGADLHRFFAAWVSGRGHYPALRVGRQPYGIMVTSAWKSWASAPAFTASALLGGACA
jgi:hypothetical protein